jgi:hypothetical protein
VGDGGLGGRGLLGLHGRLDTVTVEATEAQVAELNLHRRHTARLRREDNTLAASVLEALRAARRSSGLLRADSLGRNSVEAGRTGVGGDGLGSGGRGSGPNNGGVGRPRLLLLHGSSGLLGGLGLSLHLGCEHNRLGLGNGLLWNLLDNLLRLLLLNLLRLRLRNLLLDLDGLLLSNNWLGLWSLGSRGRGCGLGLLDGPGIC